MGPDFGPGGPGYGGPGYGGPHFHHGPPHFVFAMDWWPAIGSLMMVLTIIAGLWLAGYGLLLAQALRSGRRDQRTDMRAVWSAAVARHNAVAEAFARFECDAQAVLATPGLADVRQPPTARFVDAFAEAGALATERYPAAAFAGRFIDAVEREERAWAAAVAAAERSRDARFTPDERAVLEQARRLLEVVGSSPFEQERHTALRKALRKLRDLENRTGWHLPTPAALALEERARGMLAA
ncbi:MAG: hypothetical protein QOI16_497 [Pseudonocardiales bacterium]|nr:hypothetical protein [Pseudonocardiales bacterium]